jgi:hypothetical protein
MNLRSRLVRLETRVRANPALVPPSPEAMRRAAVARQRLPNCTDAEEALRLIQGQPYVVYSSLLRLVTNDVLIQMHAQIIGNKCTRVKHVGGPPCQDVQRMSIEELMELHRSTLGVRQYVARKR